MCRTRHRTMIGCIAFVLLISGARSVGAQTSGSVDPSFGTNGVVAPNCSRPPIPILINCNERWNAVALQSDGKLVVAGARGFLIGRYNVDGTTDTTFRRPPTQFCDGTSAAHDVVVLTDGRIVAVGEACGQFVAARYLADGTPDPDFGTGGFVMTPFSAADGSASARAVIVQADGRIVVAGSTRLVASTANSVWGLARYLPDGQLDVTFGTGGRLLTGFLGSAVVGGLVLQPDGKVVVGGSIASVDTAPGGIALVRYLADGTTDATFGTTGRVVVRATGLGGATDIALQPDGKLVTVGTWTTDVDKGFVVARFTPGGQLDSTFGVDGGAAIGFGEGPSTGVTVGVQSDGKIVAAGHIDGSFGSGDFALARFLPGGALDATFGTAGRVVTDLRRTDEAGALAIQPDGKIVVVGRWSFVNLDFSTDVVGALARYLP